MDCRRRCAADVKCLADVEVPAVSLSGYLVSRTGRYSLQMWLGFVALACVLAAFGAVIRVDMSIGTFCGLLFAVSVACAPPAPQTAFVAIQAGASRRHSAAAIAISWSGAGARDSSDLAGRLDISAARARSSSPATSSTAASLGCSLT